MSTQINDVQGYCPMGCGRTLFLADGGYVTCSYVHCPTRTAVSDLLDDRETEHLVTFDEQGFTVRHPLRERLGEALMSCDLHRHCAELPGPPPQLGLYRATTIGGGRWTFVRQSEGGDSSNG